MLLPRLNPFEDSDRLAIAIDPDAAGPTMLADAKVNFAAIHAQDRVIPMGNRFGFANDVMTDHGAAEAVGAGIGVAAVHQLPVEEEHITGIHDQRDRLVTGRQFHRIVDEADVGIGIDCALRRECPAYPARQRDSRFPSSQRSTAIQAATQVPGSTRK